MRYLRYYNRKRCISAQAQECQGQSDERSRRICGEAYPPHASCALPGNGAWQDTKEQERDLPSFVLAPEDLSVLLEEEMREEKDFRMLQSMYPEQAKQILPLIEEECDRMEYEGSSMFDAYPDLTTMYRICEKVRRNLDEAQKKIPGEEEEETFLAMNSADRGRTAADDLIRVMLIQEMHRRRCHHRHCRRGF